MFVQLNDVNTMIFLLIIVYILLCTCMTNKESENAQYELLVGALALPAIFYD